MSENNATIGYSLFIAIVAAFGGLLFGYHTGVISGAILFISDQIHLTVFEQELVVSTVLIGALIGAIFGGVLSDRLGRKKTLFLTSIVFFISTFVLSFSENFFTLLIGRFIAGLGVGVVSLCVPLYIAEIAKPKNRGALVSLNQLAITLGFVLAYGVNYYFAASADWRAMFAFSFVPTMLLFIGLFFIPETPSWLFSKGKNEQAEKVLKKIHLSSVNHTPTPEAPQKSVKWNHLWDKAIRPALYVGIGMSVFQQITGINTVFYYAPSIFQIAGFATEQTALFATLGIGIINVIMTIVALWILDIVGRRPLLIFGLIGMVLSLLILGFTLLTPTPIDAAISVVSLMFYVAFFALSLGPIAWLIISEIYPLGIRGRAMGIASFANWICNYFVSLTFLTLVGWLGLGGSFIFYGCIGIIALWFVYKKVPETKGKSLDQIQKFWIKESKPS